MKENKKKVAIKAGSKCFVCGHEIEYVPANTYWPGDVDTLMCRKCGECYWADAPIEKKLELLNKL